MDPKTLAVLEFHKILERLAGFAAFSASVDLAHRLRPTASLEEALRRQALTTQARQLLSLNAGLGVGGAADVRPLADLAARNGVLTAADLLALRTTLVAARSLGRSLEHFTAEAPLLAAFSAALQPPAGLVDTIGRAISDDGEVLDAASERLAAIRRDLKASYDHLMTRLQRMISDPRTAPMLQEAIITQRNGRHVIPLRAEFKGRIRAIIHDLSSSGATLFIEPLAVVEMNNRWHELQLEERDEERRILAEISAQVGASQAEISRLMEALAGVDLAFACARYAVELDAVEPELLELESGTRRSHPGSVLRLRRARHPLIDPVRVVPIDVELDERTYVVVITGPNTGGKTVSLKTVGLLALMAQSGLHIPAESGSALTLFKSIYADIGDEQSIEQSLSTFSGHITNIVHILNRADRRSLVLLDELGAGTDPQEGAALARAILAHLLEKQVTSLVATHYPELKVYAHSTAGVTNASMEFDMQTLRPTYRLTIGLPGRSNAVAIAERLGLSAGIIAAARSQLDPQDLQADDLLDEIHHQREQTRLQNAAAAEARLQAEEVRQVLQQRLEKIEDERHAILEAARAEAGDQVSTLQAEVAEVRRLLQRARQPLQAADDLRPRVDALVEQVETPSAREVDSAQSSKPLRVGEKVRLRSPNIEAVVTCVNEDDVEVQAGTLRMRARREDLVRRGDAPTSVPQPSTRRQTPADRTILPDAAPPGMELNLRGLRAEEALDRLERFIEAAYYSGMPFVRIIHGKGTGALRQAVRQALQESPHIHRFETGGDREGGDGVTVARLAED